MTGIGHISGGVRMVMMCIIIRPFEVGSIWLYGTKALLQAAFIIGNASTPIAIEAEAVNLHQL